jgi:hypothetical protein
MTGDTQNPTAITIGDARSRLLALCIAAPPAGGADSDVVVMGYRLTVGQEAFAQAVASGVPFNQAGAEAGVNGPMLMTKPHIRRRIEDLKAGGAGVTELAAEAVARRIMGLCDDRSLAERLIQIVRDATATPAPRVEFKPGEAPPDYGRTVPFPRPDLDAEIARLRAENERLTRERDAVCRAVRQACLSAAYERVREPSPVFRAIRSVDLGPIVAAAIKDGE